jgi:CTP synthase
MVKRSLHPKRKIKLALVRALIPSSRRYLSVAEAVRPAGIANETEVELSWLSARQFTDEAAACSLLEGGPWAASARGNDDLGLEGKAACIKCARKNNLPFFGINSGMEMAVIELRANVLHLSGANRSDLAPDTPFPVIKEAPIEPSKSCCLIARQARQPDIQLTANRWHPSIRQIHYP